MRNILLVATYTLLQVTILFMVLMPVKCLHPHHFTYHEKVTKNEEQTHMQPQGSKKEVGMELYPTGSSLPDCSHACGPCTPCKRVMVSFKCSTNVAEPCPIVYRCMCKGKYYHVPSN